MLESIFARPEGGFTVLGTTCFFNCSGTEFDVLDVQMMLYFSRFLGYTKFFTLDILIFA